MMTPWRPSTARADAERHQQRERVPEADRLTQARRAKAVLEQGRVDLSCKRPNSGGSDRKHEKRGEELWSASHEDREEKPDSDETEIRKPAVEVAPGEVWRDRPRDAQPAPDDEEHERAERDETHPRDAGQRNDPRHGQPRLARSPAPATPPRSRRSRRSSRRRPRAPRRRAAHPPRRWREQASPAPSARTPRIPPAGADRPPKRRTSRGR